ncbi:hypothetical protein [uncultured Cellulomonas sp.]|uniref:hypothetical protein n=1 Tax=uncultured Cellulomonas sp. TaxID=189682 RepID=UPI0028E50D69|nr:hypothetical protein [uncultured Cellulomonas sp.]
MTVPGPAGVPLRYEPLAATFTLRRALDDVAPSAVFDTALEPLAALTAVIDPLAFDLWLAARPASEADLARSELPVKPLWHRAVEHPPDDVRPAPPPGRPVERSTSPRLSDDDLRAWFVHAVDQPPPLPGMVLTLGTLVCEDQRALLLAQPSPRSCELHLHDLVLTRPCEPATGGAWVGFPLPGLTVSPPVRVRVTNEGNALVADLWLSWAPWSQPGRPERAAVEAGLGRMAEQGWVAQDDAGAEG